MWKLLALASLAAAQDVGERVEFPRGHVGVFAAAYNSGESLDVLEPWNTVILQGVTDDPGVKVDARRRVAGVWTPWTQGAVKRFPGGRFWGRVRFAGPPSPGTVQVHVLAAGRSEIFSIEAFDQRDAEKPGAQQQSVDVSSRGAVHGRAEWGARPPKDPYTPHTPAKVTLHHTAGRRTTTLEDSLKEVRFIQDFHQSGRGWNDIGYHYLVDSEGNVFEGRPEGVVGAHVRGANSGNVGISLLGYHHEPRNEAVSPAALAAVEKLARALSLDYQIPPVELRGHRDFGSGTSCPGDLGYAELPGLRRRLSQPPPSAINPAAKITRYSP